MRINIMISIELILDVKNETKRKEWFSHCFSVAIPRLEMDLVTHKSEPSARERQKQTDEIKYIMERIFDQPSQPKRFRKMTISIYRRTQWPWKKHPKFHETFFEPTTETCLLTSDQEDDNFVKRNGQYNTQNTIRYARHCIIAYIQDSGSRSLFPPPFNSRIPVPCTRALLLLFI